MTQRASIGVMHVVEASGGGDVIYGKERVIHWLMRAQRDAGEIRPRLAVFAPCALADAARAEGFDVDVLGDVAQTVPLRALAALRQTLRAGEAPVLHTHGYKANILGRYLRLTFAPMNALVSTCHGFVVYEPTLRFYNALDRSTGWFSDIVTAPDPGMLRRFPPGVRTRWVPNAIPDEPVPNASMRARGRERFALRDNEFVAGMLGRLSVEKGVMNFVEAARRSENAAPPSNDRPGLRWVAAGSGPLEQQMRDAAPASLSLLGFLSPADDFIAAIDVYVQPSLTEGLSLSLLEAMRSGLPIVATNVGATGEVLTDGENALLVRPDPDAIAAGVRAFRDDPALRAQLGAAARRRFEERFRMDRIEREYADVYRGVARHG